MADRRVAIGAEVSARAFVDESARGSSHHMCVAMIANDDVLCRLVRSFCPPGQRRWQVVHECDSRRRQIIDALVDASGLDAGLLRRGPSGSSDAVRAYLAQHHVEVIVFPAVLTRLMADANTNKSADSDAEHLLRLLRIYGYLAPQRRDGSRAASTNCCLRTDLRVGLRKTTWAISTDPARGKMHAVRGK